jgi:cytochrome c
MKKGAVLLLLLAFPAILRAGEGPSVERGKELFTGSTLGTNGKSCASCHSGGRKLEKAAAYAEDDLADIVNACISKPLAGKPLPTGSDEMKSLIMYIRTFAAPAR